MDYFDCDYFGSYFDTPDCDQPVTAGHRVGRVVIPPPVELDEADEFLAVI